jgi:hypothetical protein
MADVSAPAPIFSRGSSVLDYWLVHSEGMTVEPLGARVEEVVVTAPLGHAEALIVRSRMTRRRKEIPAESIAAVEPSTGHLLLDPQERHVGLRTARARVVGAARVTRAATVSAFAWLRPRAVQAGTTTARHSRSAAVHTGTGVAWLAPRVAGRARTAGATGARLTLAAAVIVARGAARAARELERAAASAAERGRASLERRRARRQRTPDD